ncbi:hypothetical protein PLICRDRAFT_37903 [Plicaturopsis crispa FD-325 SS-3]|nr:hypothetical protein PLICRDRAFT_37903 [Plicaturopsis crispa FD-325 SS-3]
MSPITKLSLTAPSTCCVCMSTSFPQSGSKPVKTVPYSETVTSLFAPDTLFRFWQCTLGKPRLRYSRALRISTFTAKYETE